MTKKGILGTVIAACLIFSIVGTTILSPSGARAINDPPSSPYEAPNKANIPSMIFDLPTTTTTKNPSMVKDVPTTKNFSSTATCQQLSIQGVTKSAGGKSPTYAIDNSYDTYWSNNRLGSWIKIDFGSSKILCSINIAWFKGNLRIYNFDVLVSNDGATFTKKLSSKTSSGTTNSLETYNLPTNTMGRYVKIVVNGNNRNSQAGIVETVASGANPTPPPPPPPPPPTSANYDDFEGTTYTLGEGQISPNGKWQAIYAQGGPDAVIVKKDTQTGNNAMFFNPTPSKGPTFPPPPGQQPDLHSSLVVSTAKYKDFDLTLDVKTVKQLRTPTPNNWENAWVMWNRPTAADDFHYYAYTLFANGGGQLEKKDNNLHDDSLEIYLAYPDSPSIKYDTWQKWRIMVTGTATGTPNIQIWIDGVQTLNYTDNDPSIPRNSATMKNGGSIVLYCEDSVTAFDYVSIKPL